MKAVWNNEIIAESDKTLVIENNHYFPPEAVQSAFLIPSRTTSTCPWKGEAHYYNLQVKDKEVKDAAWYYPTPKKGALLIKDYVAFGKDIKVEPTQSFEGENNKLLSTYLSTRFQSEKLCIPLETEDYVVQPVEDVSPPKWHLGHTTWFFETMVLIPYSKNYQVFDSQYNFVFNSYYESLGARVIRTDRGNLSRPTVDQVYAYRQYVDAAMKKFILEENPSEKVESIIFLGCQHEQQHQELLLTDIKYILGHNPLFPSYDDKKIEQVAPSVLSDFLSVKEGVYEIGYEGDGFCFDNELQRHKVFLRDFQIATRLVTNEEYLEFINAGGYKEFIYWHNEGWEWVKENKAKAPLYWHLIDERWHSYTLGGLVPLELEQPVTHINYFEATAFAQWKGMRLPTEAEWETAASKLNWGDRWEWTESAYLPYPGFVKAEGAMGEYNGKFMVNQTVLRGASVATPKEHGRKTYRNFFKTHQQWQFTGIRLVK